MSTDNLTPEQRTAAKRMRKVLALLVPGVPERRLLVAALDEFVEVMLAPMRACFERQEAELCAVELAVEERLGREGREPSDDEPITPSDYRRAEEILEFYPRADTK